MIDTRLNEIGEDEYRDRYRRAQEVMSRDGIDLLIAWSDCYRMSNVRWLTNYRAFDGFIPYAAMTLVPAKGDPILLVTEGLVPSAASSTWVKDVREIRRELPRLLREFAGSGNQERGHCRIPLSGGRVPRRYPTMPAGAYQRRANVGARHPQGGEERDRDPQHEGRGPARRCGLRG